MNKDIFNGVEIGNKARYALLINYFQLLFLLVKIVVMKAIY